MTVPAAAHAREAARSLRAAGQRTLLALVGIVVGIGAVIALLTVGGIAKSEARKQFQSLGTDMLSVVDTTRDMNSLKRKDILDATDAADLERLATIRAAAPYTLDSAELALDSQTPRSIRRLGVTTAFRDMYNVRLTAGRFITPFDHRQPFVVLGAGVAQSLRESGLAPEVGLRLQLGRGIYTVVGILGDARSSPPGTRLTDSVLIPLELALRKLATKELQGITLRTAPDVHYLAATEEIQGHFRLTAPNLTVRVDSPVPIIEQMEAQMRLFALLLGAVGGISLVVGGFGVMNAMLASVAERRLEIGIRRALGARRGDVQRQFLAEAVLLCLVGGLFGALLGVGASAVIGAVADWTWEWSPTAVVLGVGTACAAGLFFGFYPARQAALLDPIAAMRDR